MWYCMHILETAVIDSEMYLRTHIWAGTDLEEIQIARLKDWIMGQLSDGWGEGVENWKWKGRNIHKPVIYFDEDYVDFEEDEETCYVSYHVDTWDNWGSYLELEECEEVEEETNFETVATLQLPAHRRQVLKFTSEFHLRLFMQNIERGSEFADNICESHPSPKKAIYVVIDLDGDSIGKLIPIWTIEVGTTCILHRAEEERGTSTSLINAITEMLK